VSRARSQLPVIDENTSGVPPSRNTPTNRWNAFLNRVGRSTGEGRHFGLRADQYNDMSVMRSFSKRP